MGQVADRATEFKGLARQAAGAAARLLFPPTCPSCRRQVSRTGTLCGACWPTLRLIDEPWCPVMGTPFAMEMGEGFLSGEAIANPSPFDRARSAALYTGAAREMAQRLKYGDRPDLAPWMAEWMARAGRELLGEADMIVPVPLHRRRFLARRFNQSAELARALAIRHGIAFRPDALLRIKRTARQVGLERAKRIENVSGAFRVPDSARVLVESRRVLLIDDVYTTGATAFAATRALKRAGAAAVDVLTFARVLPGDFRDDDDDTI